MATTLKVSVDTRQLLAALKKAGKETAKELRKAMGEQMEGVKQEASRTHRFRVRSNNLVRSITPRVSRNGLQVLVELNEGVAKYGRFIHDGFKSWAPDQFLYKALRTQKRKIVQGISNGIARALRKARLI